jgi:hypothetical protein
MPETAGFLDLHQTSPRRNQNGSSPYVKMKFAMREAAVRWLSRINPVNAVRFLRKCSVTFCRRTTLICVNDWLQISEQPFLIGAHLYATS